MVYFFSYIVKTGMVTMYYKMSESNKTIHNMAIANLFICKQEVGRERVESLWPFLCSFLGIPPQENRNLISRNKGLK